VPLKCHDRPICPHFVHSRPSDTSHPVRHRMGRLLTLEGHRERSRKRPIQAPYGRLQAAKHKRKGGTPG